MTQQAVRVFLIWAVRISAIRSFNAQQNMSFVLRRDGDAFVLTYEPALTPTSAVLQQVLSAGPLRELTLKEQNVDELIARMYKELAL